MSDVFELFRALSERALAGATRAPSLVDVAPLIDRGWLLSYQVSDGEEQVRISAIVESHSPRTPAALRYSYRQPEQSDPRRLAHLERVGRLLCRALGRARLSTVPEVPRVIEETQSEPLGLYLAGMCDRGCVFCSRSLYSEAEARAVAAEAAASALASAVRLPVVPASPSAGRGMTLAEVEAELRPRAAEAERFTVGWSGLDCIASPHFDASLRLAHELGFRNMSIQTPGSRLLEPGFLDFLAAHSVTDVSLTAHARSEAVFDRVGGKAGAYRMFWDAVAALRERGFTLRYEVPCIADTVDDLPSHLAELAAQPGDITVFYWYPAEDLNHRFATLGMPMSRAIDALTRAREHVEARRVAVDGLPRCVVPEALVEHYTWDYGHMVFLECERLEICAGCSLRESCPGAAPIYLAHHPWPAHARAL